MKYARTLIALSALLSLAAAATSAKASLITETISFNASGFALIGGIGNTPPVDPVFGSFTITFDPTVVVTNQTSGISLNSINITFADTLAFNVNPSGQLLVGGLANGVLGTLAETNDFVLQINQIATNPTFS